MKKIKLYIILITCLSSFSSWVPSPEFHYLNYDIFIADDNKIGEMRAIKSISGNVINYSVQTKISFRVFQSYDINYQLSSSYKNDQLVETVLKNVVNGKLENNVKLIWNGEKYIGTNNNKPYEIKERIKISTAYLYFHEPKVATKVFSDKFSEFNHIESEGNGIYTLHLSDGNKSKYTYKNGICQEATTVKNFVKIKLKLRNS
jgi:hypothetical protein